MKTVLKRTLYVVVLTLFYFTVWSSVRGWVTTYTVLPQVELAKEYCNKTIYVDQNRPTSTIIHVYNERNEQYDTIYYTTPAGFYLLFGLVFVILFGGAAIYYKVLLGYHLGFWILSIISMMPGFCIHPLFFHVSNLGIIYLTPFVTFLVIIFLMSPKLLTAFKISDQQK
ncbi:MAG: hypothetical protein EA391_06245 [Balneolaceae bacterium]|nr:MAG: hypothetical protein EA391_06245 [Balneolaceae bacterium]